LIRNTNFIQFFELKEEGIVEQIEFSTNSTEDFEHARKELDEIGIPLFHNSFFF
jgi:hypothetical protein